MIFFIGLPSLLVRFPESFVFEFQDESDRFTDSRADLEGIHENFNHKKDLQKVWPA